MLGTQIIYKISLIYEEAALNYMWNGKSVNHGSINTQITLSP